MAPPAEIEKQVGSVGTAPIRSKSRCARGVRPRGFSVEGCSRGMPAEQDRPQLSDDATCPSADDTTRLLHSRKPNYSSSQPAGGRGARVQNHGRGARVQIAVQKCRVSVRLSLVSSLIGDEPRPIADAALLSNPRPALASLDVNEVYESGEERKSARNNGEQDARSSESRRAKRRNGYGYGLLGIADVVS
ncbi:hypothetical protein HPB47_008298 [Ixodes persulcatus]|uniref:Uncharacterized protein n=1 Tax=Ixodes persulcatus TaxID=34615 RepID=A0AC60P5E0_IXOPE|nr:hypothetical protein HPB47_008298 [Ixodes persulcatus]